MVVQGEKEFHHRCFTVLYIRQWSKLKEFFHSLYFTLRAKMLLNETVEQAQLTKL